MNMNVKQLKRLFISGSNELINNRDRIDTLNVFPVPDGDTGSNMAATVEYSIGELNGSDIKTVGDLSSVFARATLMGARGNSGVIFSQFFKGIAKGLEGCDKATPADFVKAFIEAKKYSYKSVMKPVEGTILTVINDISKGMVDLGDISQMNFSEFLNKATSLARTSTDNTPNLLPILKEVGVVDSGAEGLFCFIYGMQQAWEGKPIKLQKFNKDDISSRMIPDEVFDGEFGYCTEFIVELTSPNLFKKEKFRKDLEKFSNSIIIVVDEEILKVHLHTLTPGKVFTFAQNFGEFLKIKSENMALQVADSSNKKEIIEEEEEDLFEEKKKNAIISINTGQGLISEMRKLGVNFIIEGGQSMNPSAHDIVEAINSVNAENVFILPNNSNIILTSQQAAQATVNKKVVVISTKSQMQGFAAAMNFNREAEFEENKEEMNLAIEEVISGQVTTASRTTKIQDVRVNEGEFLTIVDKKILGSHKSKVSAALEIVKVGIKKDVEIITIYYGLDASKMDALEIASYIEENSEDVEVEVVNGMQPIYHFLISME